jgi:hypothetical protein
VILKKAKPYIMMMAAICAMPPFVLSAGLKRNVDLILYLSGIQNSGMRTQLSFRRREKFTASRMPFYAS